MAKESIVGKKVLMKSGHYAVCIEFRRSDDIDVQFEDGTIVKRKTKQNFLNGSVRNPNYPKLYSSIKKASCEGKSVLQNCGMVATCIIYRNSRDIDVQFEDGTIVQHRSKENLYSGNILHPKLKRKLTKRLEKASCLGLEKIMNNGMKAKCISYRGYSDIDVQFEDGTVVEHKKKGDFLEGRIQSPLWWEKSFPQRILFECVSKYFPNSLFNFRPVFLKNPNTGLNLEIDIWIPEICTVIEYDGFPWHSKETARSKLKYDLFVSSEHIKKIYTILEEGCIEHTSFKHKNIILETNHVTSHFDLLESAVNNLLHSLGIEESIVLDETTLNAIREKCNNQNLGICIKQNCGMEATCIAYREHNDIDIQFEDGTIVKHRSKSSFLKGLIKNPVLFKKIQEESCLNRSVIMKNGQIATCIVYRGCNDIDVQFEDGTIVTHVQKQHFIRGGVGNPNINVKNKLASCIGLTLKMNNGMNATCIAYRNERSIDIQFEDGTIVRNKRKSNFTRGEIENPSYNPHSCLNKIARQSCGLDAKCVEYRNCNDIDVLFSDGVLVKHKRKQQFCDGNIKHPSINSKSLKASCLGLTRRMNNGMYATCIEYRNHKDIDIRFDDGLIVKHRRKSRFIKGAIAHKIF